MPKFNLGWLKDKNGEKFAPKTFTTQVLDDTGRKNLNEILDNKIDSPTTAKVGQLLEVEDVDANGNPIKWKAVDAPNNQIQADWDQNDEAQLDYVKNKPFYSRYGNRLELLSLSNYEFEYGGAYYWHQIINSNENATTENHYIKPNTEYEVNWKGNIYKLKSKTYVDKNNITYTYVGNIYYTYNIIHPQPNQNNWDTGEPFLFVSYGDYYSLTISCKNQELVDGRILLSLHEYSDKDEYEVVARYLDEKYIPNNIPKIKSASIGQLLVVLSVDSDGKPTSFGVVDDDSVKTSDLKNYVTSAQYATSSKVGVVRTSTSYGTKMSGQYIQTEKATTSEISSKSNQYKPIVPYNLDEAVRYGLGDSKITWTDDQKKKAREVIGAISLEDIPESSLSQTQPDWEQNNSTKSDYIKNKPFYENEGGVIFQQSVNLINYGDDTWVANNLSIPIESGKEYQLIFEDIDESFVYDNSAGIFYIGVNGQLVFISNSSFYIQFPKVSTSGTLIVKAKPELKKLDEKFIPDSIPKVSSATVGQTLEVEETDENGKPIKWKAVDKDSGSDVDLSEYVKFTDYAGKDNFGVIRAYPTGDKNVPGVGVSGNGIIGVVAATETNIDAKETQKVITPTNLDYAIKSGLTTNSLEWTDTEKKAARDLIGAGTGSGSGFEGTVVESVEQTTTSTASGGINIVTVTKSDGSTNEVEILNGKDGVDGKDGANGLTPHIDEDGYIVYGEGKLDEILEEIERLKDITSSVTYDENTGDLTISSYIYSYDETTGNLII